MGQMSVDSEVYNDWCLPHIYDDCSPTSNARGSNLLFGCVSAATVLKNAFVLVRVNRFQQIIGVYTLQAPSYGNKATWLSRLHDAQENYREACRKLDVKRLSTAECAAATAAGVDINVLQCDENISFVESTTDVAASPQQGVFGGPPGSSAALLGVPRADGLQAFASQTCRATGCTRTVRSSSSDAASTLQPDSNPQSPSADDSGAQPRRTSDPLCSGGAASSGQDGAGQENVEIVISFDPHDPAASLSSVNSSGSGGSTAKLQAGCALAPPPILSPNYWSSATSLHHFPTTKFASSATADSNPSVLLPQSLSSCSLNPPPALLKPSLLSNTPFSRQLSASVSERHRPKSTSSTSSSERVFARHVLADEYRQSSPVESDDDDDDDDGGGGGGGYSGSVFRADRGSESTPLLTQQVRGKRVEAPSSLICCTPPRHRRVPRHNLPPSPLACVTPPQSVTSPTDIDVAEFCAPSAARPKRTRHASLHRRRSRKAALFSFRHEKWQSTDLPDT